MRSSGSHHACDQKGSFTISLAEECPTCPDQLVTDDTTTVPGLLPARTTAKSGRLLWLAKKQK